MVHINVLLSAGIFCLTGMLAAPKAEAAEKKPTAIPIGTLSPEELQVNTFRKAKSAKEPLEIIYTKEDLAGFSAISSPASDPPANTTTSDKEEADRRRWIYPPDDRELWSPTYYPWSAPGRFTKGGAYCSGVLVGRRHVLTAKHCVVGIDGPARFAPSYYDGERLGGSDVYAFIRLSNPPPNAADGWTVCSQLDDWTIAVLNDPIGDTNGWFQSRTINCDAEKDQAKFYHIGYPGDLGGQRPYRLQGIPVVNCNMCNNFGPLLTYADVMGGQSGGALWALEGGVRNVVGTLSLMGTYSSFGGGEAMVQAINRARADFP